MKARTRTRRFGIAALAVFGLALAGSGVRAQGRCPHASRTTADPTLAPLDERTRAAVTEALQDELRSEAQYLRAVEQGAGRPFAPVARAEQRHAEFLRALLRGRQLPLPEAAEQESAVVLSGSTASDGTAPDGVAEACAAAIASEARNVALYDRLLAAGPLPPDVKAVFEHNRWASLAHHTPAFERCAGLAPSASATGEPGAGCGAGHGRRSDRGPAGCGHAGRPGGDGRGGCRPCGGCGSR